MEGRGEKLKLRALRVALCVTPWLIFLPKLISVDSSTGR